MFLIMSFCKCWNKNESRKCLYTQINLSFFIIVTQFRFVKDFGIAIFSIKINIFESGWETRYLGNKHFKSLSVTIYISCYKAINCKNGFYMYFN